MKRGGPRQAEWKPSSKKKKCTQKSGIDTKTLWRVDQGCFYAEVIADEDQLGEAGGGVTGRRMENSIAAGRAACHRPQLYYEIKVFFYQRIIGNAGIAVCRRGGWLAGWMKFFNFCLQSTCYWNCLKTVLTCRNTHPQLINICFSY